MSILYRTLLAAKKISNVVFTVQEWEFFRQGNFITNDRLVGALPYMSVRIGTETRLTDAHGQAGFNLAPGTYTYEVFDMARYLTTSKGTVTVAAVPVGVDVKVYAAMYTPTQVQNMIANHNYIPVSSDIELDGLRHATPRRMGQGTIHDTVSNVVTGVDKKYIQVGNINLVNFQSGNGWNPFGVHGNTFIGVYNGNNLVVYNFFTKNPFSSIFGIIFNATISYMVISGRIETLTNHSGFVCGLGYGINMDINNVQACGEIIGLNYIGGIIGCNYEFFPTIPLTGGKISFCSFSGSIIGNGTIGGIAGFSRGIMAKIESCDANVTFIGNMSEAGGIVGNNNISAIVDDCEAVVSFNGAGIIIGGIAGFCQNSSILKSISSGVLTSTNTATRIIYGGLVGQLVLSTINRCSSSVIINGGTNNECGGAVGEFVGSTIENSYATGNISCTSRLGGLIGNIRDGGNIINNYSTGLITGVSSIGGLVGRIAAPVTPVFINNYYDRNTSGRSDTGRGLPRTTQQMQVGTRNSFINPDGTIDHANNPANAMYTDWNDTTTWNFDDITKYPFLR